MATSKPDEMPHVKIIKRKINGHEYAYLQGGSFGRWSDETVERIKEMLLPANLKVEVVEGEHS